MTLTLILIMLQVFIYFTWSTNFGNIVFNSFWKIHRFHFFPYKILSEQNWPCSKIGQGQPRVIIYINLVVPEYPMLQTKFQGLRPYGSGEEDFFKVFTLYGHGGHLGHVTWTIYINFHSPFPRKIHMKFGFDWPSGFRGEDLWKIRTDDDRRTDARACV